ncbi:hypothetical protein DFH09DRAFT_1083590 [Mycena vulgaris]|nr:hypothetical protein DFH09DRAFT_1083590 [Mycena vulgaris]
MARGVPQQKSKVPKMNLPSQTKRSRKKKSTDEDDWGPSDHEGPSDHDTDTALELTYPSGRPRRHNAGQGGVADRARRVGNAISTNPSPAKRSLRPDPDTEEGPRKKVKVTGEDIVDGPLKRAPAPVRHLPMFDGDEDGNANMRLKPTKYPETIQEEEEEEQEQELSWKQDGDRLTTSKTQDDLVGDGNRLEGGSENLQNSLEAMASQAPHTNHYWYNPSNLPAQSSRPVPTLLLSTARSASPSAVRSSLPGNKTTADLRSPPAAGDNYQHFSGQSSSKESLGQQVRAPLVLNPEQQNRGGSTSTTGGRTPAPVQHQPSGTDAPAPPRFSKNNFPLIQHRGEHANASTGGNVQQPPTGQHPGDNYQHFSGQSSSKESLGQQVRCAPRSQPGNKTAADLRPPLAGVLPRQSNINLRGQLPQRRVCSKNNFPLIQHPDQHANGPTGGNVQRPPIGQHPRDGSYQHFSGQSSGKESPGQHVRPRYPEQQNHSIFTSTTGGGNPAIVQHAYTDQHANAPTGGSVQRPTGQHPHGDKYQHFPVQSSGKESLGQQVRPRYPEQQTHGGSTFTTGGRNPAPVLHASGSFSFNGRNPDDTPAPRLNDNHAPCVPLHKSNDSNSERIAQLAGFFHGKSPQEVWEIMQNLGKCLGVDIRDTTVLKEDYGNEAGGAAAPRDYQPPRNDADGSRSKNASRNGRIFYNLTITSEIEAGGGGAGRVGNIKMIVEAIKMLTEALDILFRTIKMLVEIIIAATRGTQAILAKARFQPSPNVSEALSITAPRKVTSADLKGAPREQRRDSERDPVQSSRSSPGRAQSPDEDVLATHRVRTRAPRVPSAEKLQHHKMQQMRLRTDVPAPADVSSDSGDEEDEDDDDDDEEEEGGAKRKTRTSKPPAPHNLSYYKGDYRTGLITAKRNQRLYVVRHHLFPGKKAHMDKSHEMVIQALNQYEREAERKLNNEIYFSHSAAMDSLVWAEVATFRCRGKERARIVVERHFQRAFYPYDAFTEEQGYGQNKFEQVSADKVMELLEGSAFIQHRAGPKKPLLNATHPAIKDLLDAWIFGGGSKPLKDPLIASFPQVITSIEVEDVAAIITLMKNSLDERANGFFTPIKCTADRYLDYYNDAVETLRDILAMENTGPLVRATWDLWRRVTSKATRVSRGNNFQLADDIVDDGSDGETELCAGDVAGSQAGGNDVVESQAGDDGDDDARSHSEPEAAGDYDATAHYEPEGYNNDYGLDD